MEQEYRTPNDNEYSDWKYALQAAGSPIKNDDIKHMHACVFGENDGPSWVWVIELKNGDFGYLTAWCDYTGWGCQDGGEWFGGFKSALEAAEAVEDKRKDVLIAQVNGEKPYALA